MTKPFTVKWEPGEDIMATMRRGYKMAPKNFDGVLFIDLSAAAPLNPKNAAV